MQDMADKSQRALSELEEVNATLTARVEELQLQPLERLRENLSSMDDMLLCRLDQGDIELLDRSFLLSLGASGRIERRQNLRKRYGDWPFVGPRKARQLVENCQREIGVLSFGWPTRGNADPTGDYLRAVQRFLRERPEVKAVFWDFPCLHQHGTETTRTEEENLRFKAALDTMADLYASPLATVVMQIPVVPQRPPAFDGLVRLANLPAGMDGAGVRTALAAFMGAELADIERIGVVKDGEVDVAFKSHASARELVARLDVGSSGTPGPLADASAFFAFNDRPYMDRGWCILEDAVATEIMAWLQFYPKTSQMIAALTQGRGDGVEESADAAQTASDEARPKIYELSLDESVRSRARTFEGSGNQAMNDKFEETVRRIQSATFTSGSDKARVVRLYKDYHTRIMKKVSKLAQKFEEDETARRAAQEFMAMKVHPLRRQYSLGGANACSSASPGVSRPYSYGPERDLYSGDSGARGSYTQPYAQPSHLRDPKAMVPRTASAAPPRTYHSAPSPRRATPPLAQTRQASWSGGKAHGSKLLLSGPPHTTRESWWGDREAATVSQML